MNPIPLYRSYSSKHESFIVDIVLDYKMMIVNTNDWIIYKYFTHINNSIINNTKNFTDLYNITEHQRNKLRKYRKIRNLIKNQLRIFRFNLKIKKIKKNNIKSNKTLTILDLLKELNNK